MKVTLMLAFFSIAPVFAATLNSQSIQLKAKELTVRNAFKEIEHQSEYSFFYNSDFSSLNTILIIQDIETDIHGAMEIILKSTNLTYRILDNNLIVIEPDLLLQDIIVTGQVFDNETQEALPAATILIKGTNIGTTSDVSGKYSIVARGPGDVLSFSFIGYETKEITVGTQTNLNVGLSRVATALDEFVVTALGISRSSRALAYSVGEVSSEEIRSSLVSNPLAALAGTVPGVLFKSTSDQAGGHAYITIRGNSSLNYDNQALLIVDGVPVANVEVGMIDQSPGGSTMLDFDPANVESITVLKGAAASALYGSRAANGVVLITTKSGRFNMEPKIMVSHRSSFERIYERPMQKTWASGAYNTSTGEYEYWNPDIRPGGNSWGPKISDLKAAGVAQFFDKWDVFQTGYTAENSFSITGGSDIVSYFGSVNHTAQQGVLDPIKLGRISFSTNFSVKVTSRLKSTIGLQYSRTLNDRLVEGNWPSTSFMITFLGAPWTWNPNPLFFEDGRQRSYVAAGRNNYLWTLDHTSSNTERHRFLPTFGLEYQLAEGLTVSNRAGVDFFNQGWYRYLDMGNIAWGHAGTGVIAQSTEEFLNFNNDLSISYKTSFLDDAVDIDFMLGNNIQSTRQVSQGINGQNYQIAGWHSIENAQSKVPWTKKYQRRSVSVFGQAVISYKDYLYYTFTGRNDRSSTLPIDNNSYFYSSHSLGFIFTDVLKNNRIVEYGKLSASYANVGGDAGAYLVHTRFTAARPSITGPPAMQFPYQGIGSFVLGSQAGNPAIRAENTVEYELGLELRGLNNRIRLESAVYSRISKDQILSVNLPNSAGFGSALMNVGQISNKGFELLLTGTPLQEQYLKWDVSINLYANRSNVDKIAPELSEISRGFGLNIIEGQPFMVFRGYEYIRDDNGNKIVLDNPSNPRHGYYQVDMAGTTILGKNEPDLLGGLQNTLTYKNFSLLALLDFSVGAHVNNGTEGSLLSNGQSVRTENRPTDNIIVHEGMKGYFDETGRMVITGVNDIAVQYARGYQNYYYYVLEETLQHADFVKLRSVSLSYSLPDKLLKNLGWLDNGTITFTGRNLWRRFHKDFTGPDPEFNQYGSSGLVGYFNNAMPATKTFSFSLNLEF